MNVEQGSTFLSRLRATLSNQNYPKLLPAINTEDTMPLSPAVIIHTRADCEDSQGMIIV